MKRAGLDHIRQVGSRKWVAVLVSVGSRKVFVVGPYPSQEAAVAAAQSLTKGGDVGYQGGFYVAYSAKTAAGNSSLVAACLQAAAQHSFGF
jgi:hypothetical protein